MIKITNLNFQTQTIENVEVDCDDVNNVELKLTKTTFKIVVVKEGQTIKKQIKKKDFINEVVDVVMDVEEPEPIKTQPEPEPQAEPFETQPEPESQAEPIETQAEPEPIETQSEPEPSETQPVEEPVVIENNETNEINEILEPKEITLGRMKELLKEHIPKPNTLDSYIRTIQQVHNHFKIEDMSELFETKEQDIISYIESNYSNNSTYH